MALDHISLEAVSEADLQRLVDDRVEEHKRIDFKETLPGGKDSDKKEFLADVSSFANAAGGDLVYGVAEEQGVATRICGLTDIDADAEIRRMEQSILTGIAPRAQVASRAVPLSSGAQVIIVRVPSSWAGPHMITFQEWSRFYSRTSKGKYPMDVFEIRALFVASETLTERVRRFRKERLAAIAANETPVLLRQGARIVLHLVPLSALRPSSDINIGKHAPQLQLRLRPMIPAGGGWSSRFNFDGMLSVASDAERQPLSYVQLFRNGRMEAVDSFMLSVCAHSPQPIIYGDEVAKLIIEHVRGYVSVLRLVGSQPPVIVMVSMLGVSGYRMTGTFDPRILLAPSVGIDRPDVLIPEVLIQEFDEPIESALRPVFDAVWNACGHPAAPLFDANGNRKDRGGMTIA